MSRVPVSGLPIPRLSAPEMVRDYCVLRTTPEQQARFVRQAGKRGFVVVMLTYSMKIRIWRKAA